MPCGPHGVGCNHTYEHATLQTYVSILFVSLPLWGFFVLRPLVIVGVGLCVRVKLDCRVHSLLHSRLYKQLTVMRSRLLGVGTGSTPLVGLWREEKGGVSGIPCSGLCAVHSLAGTAERGGADSKPHSPSH